MKRFSLLFGAACAFTVVFAPVMACADTPAQQQAHKYQAVPSSALLLEQLTAPLSWKPQDLAWKPQDLDGLIKRLRSGNPVITGLTAETKNALLQTLMLRQKVGQMELKNAQEALLLAQKRLDYFQAQAKAKAGTPQNDAQSQDMTAPQLDLMNAKAFLASAEKNLKENAALLLRAQSIPTLPTITFVPAAPSPAPLSSRALQYTPADAAALIKRNPLFTPADQAKVGVKRLDGAAQDTTGTP